ncbi:hypothetical protein G6F68_021623 [Rhizopus microsporus]|nr:hypothetical protein G6F68_021623 [Rhizopus microsporus]
MAATVGSLADHRGRFVRRSKECGCGGDAANPGRGRSLPARAVHEGHRPIPAMRLFRQGHPDPEGLWREEAGYRQCA